MKNNLFLQAPIQAGKSTLLQYAIEPYRKYIGGFLSQRLKQETKTCGFRLVDLEDSPNLTESFSPGLSNIFLNFSGEKPSFDISIFENFAINLLEKSLKTKKIIFLDEIGGLELQSKAFREYLYNLLCSDVPCLGVLKSPKAAQNTGRGIGEKLDDENVALQEKLAEGDNQILMYKRELFHVQKEQIQKFIEEKLCGNFTTSL